MSNPSFRYLIEQLAKDILGEKARGGFKLNEFKKLDRLDRMHRYADAHLELLGSGSSRSTYLLSSGKVLKIARDAAEQKGVAQNEAEIEIYTDPGLQPIVSKVFDADFNYRWVVSELVKEMTEAEFEREFGFEDWTFKDFLKAYKTFMVNKRIPETYKKALWGVLRRGDASEDELKAWFKFQKTPVWDGVRYLLVAHDMGTGDLGRSEHWGKTPEGRPVLLDYGLTMDVLRNYY